MRNGNLTKPSVALQALSGSQVIKANQELAKPALTLTALNGDTQPQKEQNLVRLLEHGNGIYAIQLAEALHSTSYEAGLQQFSQALSVVKNRADVKVLRIEVGAQGWLGGSREAANHAISANLYGQVLGFTQPVIGVFAGDTQGGDFLLACVCDFMVCSEAGKYALVSSAQEYAATKAECAFLQARFGSALSARLVQSTTGHTGAQLQALGWQSAVVSGTELAAHVARLSQSLSQKPQEALSLLKQHLSRTLQQSVANLVAGTLPVPREYQSVAAVASTSLLAVQAEGNGVLRVAIRSQGPEVAQALASLLTQQANDGQVGAVVLSSEGGDCDLGLQAVVLQSALPIVAELGTEVSETWWQVALSCDAVIYHGEGQQQVARRQLHAPQAQLFLYRFGSQLGQSILFGEAHLSSQALAQQHKASQVAEGSAVQQQAGAVAAMLAKLPIEVACWHKAELVKALADVKAWPQTPEVRGDVQHQGVTEVALGSDVIRAIAHPDGVLEVHMEDREHKNMFSDAFSDGLTAVFEHVAQTPHYKAVVLTGYGTYFSSGGTLDTLMAIGQGQMQFTDSKLYQAPLSCDIPVIAAMQGHSIGAGWALGMFADITLFSEESRYFSPYMNYGFTPGAASTLIMPAQLGYDLAMDTLLTANEHSGEQLKLRNLSQQVLPRAQVLDKAMSLARQIAQLSQAQLKAFKAQSNRALLSKLDETYKAELLMHEMTFVGQTNTLEKVESKLANDKTSQGAYAEERTVKNVTINLAALTQHLKTLLASELYLDADEIEDTSEFVELGLDSITGVTWVKNINEYYGTNIEATKVYSYPTLTKLSQHVHAMLAQQAKVQQPQIQQPKAVEQVVKAEAPQRSSEQELSFVIEELKQMLAEELHMTADEIDDVSQFIDLGLDSITGVTWVRRINELFGTKIEATKVYSYPTLKELGRHVKSEMDKYAPTRVPQPPISSLPVAAPVSEQAQDTPVTLTSWRNQAQPQVAKVEAPKATLDVEPIAIIGMAGQFPQSNNVEQYWENIAKGNNCISEVSSQRWDIDAIYQEGAPVAGKTNSKWFGAMEEYDLFDPLFFNISPTEAESMDPQQRLFLQACWHGVEDAGYAAETLSGSMCGVFVGCATGDYDLLSREQQISAQGFTGGATSILAARVSYFMNLQGPCISIDTACSSSLVAIATACDSLNLRRCDMALAGGVYVLAAPDMYIKTAQAGMLSTDGKCYTFDQRANGFVAGEGVGVVVLKRLSDAKRDQDIIQGVIQGWGVNQDGKTNGITAPNPESQARLEKEVYDQFNIDPNHIQLIEAHGTGTKLGDPIEIEGLKSAFAQYTSQVGYCALGSVKSNIGHCLTAAGVAGVIKLVMSIKHKQLPPSINFDKLNEHISLADSPFYVNDKLTPWDVADNTPRQAAVSSFGFSGTNAHMVIAEYQPSDLTPQEVGYVNENAHIMIPLSARNEERLKYKAQELLDFIGKNDKTLDLLSMAYTLQVGRDAMDARVVFLSDSIEQLTIQLQAYVEGSKSIRGIYSGSCREHKEGLKIFAQDDEMKEVVVQKWLETSNLSKLSEFWAKGMNFDWHKLYKTNKPTRVQLPVYPFAKERYWIEMEQGLVDNVVTLNPNHAHPLLHDMKQDISSSGYQSPFAQDAGLLLAIQERKTQPKRVSVPKYPFARDYCWVDTSKKATSNSESHSQKENADVEQLFAQLDIEHIDTAEAVELLKQVV
ncbi:hypothetical protein EAG18_21680 [Pseudoalteromonas sp. J010]|uniref:polyketide synthase n=1 Tax=Pseudoalteromonas sp. J010 TaxID=998465 RepID=UPI000F6503B7|nr:polyketide synthase [Pseudoalteromonas sp. J010]RRS06555.1 hypothetical protein EAG18_21680 [Pseudoalteromonas sp. J010]